ncbi:MAG: universal stress protein [Gammaproteobacteria bacterium]
MGLKDLLVYVTANPGAEVPVALNLAERHDAQITALHVVDVPSAPMALETGVTNEFIEGQRKAYASAAANAEQHTTQAAQRAGLTVEWRVSEGDTIREIATHSHYCDLVVLGAKAGRDESPFDRALAEHVVLECGKPVVIVPDSYTGGDVGRFVTVAWNGTRECARAVADAMPLLSKAEKVSVVVIDPLKMFFPLGDAPGADICRHLSRHGVQAEAQTAESAHRTKGEAIVDWAKGQGADLIVMGAYGHWRLRELVVGGATRDVLHDTAVPVLMSH